MRKLASVKRIACIGEVMIELVSEGDDLLRMGVAGDTYNTAVYLQRLVAPGKQVDMITALGTDTFSDRILSQMQVHGLGCQNVGRRDDKFPGLYAISTDDDGERSFSYWRSDSAARTIFAENSSVSLGILEGYDAVFLSGITMAILPPETRAHLMSALDDFRQRGGVFIYDSNHRPRLWESRQVAQEVNAAMWRHADIALPSVDDEMAIFGDTEDLAVLERLRSYGCTDGALKRGAAGPWDLATDALSQNYPEAELVVDTTAAGDSFNAGFLGARFNGANIAEALLQGHNLASRVIGAKGAIVPT